jgi:fructokinase
MQTIYGGVEAGGTTFVCGVGTYPEDITTVEFETTTPDETLEKVVAYFSKQPTSPAAIGVGTFGPINYYKNSSVYGTITHSPKKLWEGVNISQYLESRMGVRTATETDVTCAAIGEYYHGCGKGCESLLYISVGTGIGGGVLENGKPPKSTYQAEFGHVRIPRDDSDTFSGCCTYHGDCLEGLASATAIKRRWGVDSPEQLASPDHQAWVMEAHYLSLGVTNAMLTFAPERIIVGGGVLRHVNLIDNIRRGVTKLINGYGFMPGTDDMPEYLQSPALGKLSGVIGAIELAKQRTD